MDVTSPCHGSESEASSTSDYGPAPLVGYAVKPRKDHLLQRRYFPSKIGGSPAWLDPELLPSGELTCDSCAKPMAFLAQLYSPGENDAAFHRSIYVFACTCCPGSFRALRSQLPRDNAYYPPVPASEDDTTVSDDLVTSRSCSLCGLPRDVAECDGQGVHAACRRRLEGRWKLKVDEFGLFIEECDEEMTDSESDVLTSDLIGDEGHLLEEYEKKDEDEIMDDSEVEAFNELCPEIDADDQAHKEFEILAKANPGHVVYYCRGGEPVWLTSMGKEPASPTPCERCGAPREFEFQIQPQLVYKASCDFDFGVVAVYTCSADCEIEGYAREFTAVQNEPEEWVASNGKQEVVEIPVSSKRPDGGESAHVCTTTDDGNSSSVLDKLLDEQSEIEAEGIRLAEEVNDKQDDHPEPRPSLVDIVPPSPMVQLPSPEETPRTETRMTLARADMQDFQKSLDGVVEKLRSTAMDAFMESRQRITRRHEAESTAARLHAQATEFNLKETVKALNEQLDKANDRVATLERQMKGVQFLNHKQQKRQRTKLLMARMMARWKIYHRLQVDEKTKSKLSRALYRTKLSGEVFVAWRIRSMQGTAARKQADTELANATQRANDSAAWDEEKSSLLARIDDLTAELEKEMQTKRMMQDNLKRVFMRGVCALNFEAMSLLGGQPADESEAEEQFNRFFGSPSEATLTNPVGVETRPQDQSTTNLMTRETFIASSATMAAVAEAEGTRKEHNAQSLPFVSYDGSNDREKA
ncbi:Programmed cell death protein 2, partial [Perkinsus olseni]